MIPGSHTYNARVLISDAWEPGNEASLVVWNGKQGGESVNSEEVTIHFFVHELICGESFFICIRNYYT